MFASSGRTETVQKSATTCLLLYHSCYSMPVYPNLDSARRYSYSTLWRKQRALYPITRRDQRLLNEKFNVSITKKLRRTSFSNGSFKFFNMLLRRQRATKRCVVPGDRAPNSEVIHKTKLWSSITQARKHVSQRTTDDSIPIRLH